MRLPFNEAKATEAAAYFLKLSGGGLMSYLKLIKLLYFVDREALLRFGRPVTTDRYLLTDQGPSLSQIDDLITVGSLTDSLWSTHISALQGKLEVDLLQDASFGELSEAERELIESVFAHFGKQDHWELIRHSQTLPEWHDPHGTKIPLEYTDILRAGGKSESEIDAITAELESLAAVIVALEPYRSAAVILK